MLEVDRAVRRVLGPAVVAGLVGGECGVGRLAKRKLAGGQRVQHHAERFGQVVVRHSGRRAQEDLAHDFGGRVGVERATHREVPQLGEIQPLELYERVGATCACRLDERVVVHVQFGHAAEPFVRARSGAWCTRCVA